MPDRIELNAFLGHHSRNPSISLIGESRRNASPIPEYYGGLKET